MDAATSILRGGQKLRCLSNRNDEAASYRLYDASPEPVARRLPNTTDGLRANSAMALFAVAIEGRAQPIMLLAVNGEILLCNLAAELMLTRNGSVQIRRQRLWVSSSGCPFNSTFIARHGCHGQTTDTWVVRFRIPGADSPSTYAEVRHMRLPDLRDPGSVYLVTLSGSIPQKPHGDALRRLLGLTAAESRLVEALFVSTKRLANVAIELGISYETARSQLRAVFEKCDVRSQAELIQLVALGPFY